MTIDEYQYALSLTDDHLKALGRIVAESSLLESVIEISIWETLKLPYQVVSNSPRAPISDNL